MKKLIVVLTILLSFTLFSNTSEAKEYKMILWYPGEAGSSDIAQPIIDSFFEYINKKLAGDQLNGKYFPSEGDGRAYINSSRPAIGILSLSSYIKESKRGLQMTVIAQTKPLPSGSTSQKYYLVGPQKYKDKGLPQKIYSSEPLTTSFVKDLLFAGTPIGSSNITESRDTLNKLKTIAGGEDAAAILTEVEYKTLTQMKAPWAKEIALLNQSAVVPSAPVVAFVGAADDAFINKVKDVLSKMSGDGEARPILSSLRLSGFTNPNTGAYQAALSRCN